MTLGESCGVLALALIGYGGLIALAFFLARRNGL